MKTRYISIFFVFLAILIIIGLYFVDIPAPSRIIEESYQLEIK